MQEEIKHLLIDREIIINLMASEVCAPYIYDQLNNQLDSIHNKIYESTNRL